MMNLIDFEECLTSQSCKPELLSYYITGEEEQLLRWIATLPMQSEDEQVSQLENVLTELWLIELEDELRLKLVSIVMTATDRLVASMRNHYIHEVGSLTNAHLDVISQVKSLYYLTALVYDGVIRRASTAFNDKPKSSPTLSFWEQFVTSKQTSPDILAVAIYQLILTYQKMLCENAISYQKPPSHIWSALNENYLLARQHDIAHIDLSAHVVTHHAQTIHRLYRQSCLHSLLNVLSMRRPSILLIQRLLPEWAVYVTATLEPQSQTRIFVDLQSDHPPEYLTAVSNINPYDDQHDCLFIDLEPLTHYLRERQTTLLAMGKEVTEYRLVTSILMAITYRYIDRKATIASKYSIKQRATAITGFSNIHYHAAGMRSLMGLIAPQDLPADYLPRYDTAPKSDAAISELEVELHDSVDTISHFRTLRLFTAQDIAAQQVLESSAQKSDTHSNLLPLTDIFEPVDANDVELINQNILNELLATAPPRLQMMSLFLLNEHNKGKDESLTLGIVRWLTLDDEYVEIEGQILAHKLTACALRLDTRDDRSRSFIPALLLASDKALGTACSLLVPSYHFKEEDKVIVRLNGKQHPLRLHSSLLSTGEFTQYEVVRL